MVFAAFRVSDWLNRHLPPGTPSRKVAELTSIILVIEGLSVLLLFSYVEPILGLLSLIGGSFLLLILRSDRDSIVSPAITPGVRFAERVLGLVGGEYTMMLLGALIIALDLTYNRFFSQNSEIGDVDALAILFGFTTMLYPVIHDRYRLEASFALIFVGFAVALLVVPQSFMSLSGASPSSGAGNWYVHYMLAAPFSAILDIIGIESSSLGNLVTIQLSDGSVHTLSISAYCAGLYSFSIFLSAFLAFVLVFERLPNRVLAAVLLLGVIVAYTGNLFRMVIIGISGYYWGIDALHWAHENVGWMLFLVWSALYWWLILEYSSRHRVRDMEEFSKAS